MTVKRIVANIATPVIAKAESFYCGLLGLEQVMDHGFIRTYASSASSSAQISVASEGGSGTAVPDLSIEVDNLEEIIARVRAEGITFEYGPIVEPWGMRRFYIRDPFGRLVNILVHDRHPDPLNADSLSINASLRPRSGRLYLQFPKLRPV